MVLMLPIATDSGARLAAILPSGLACLARGLGSDSGLLPDVTPLAAAPPLRSFVAVVVDGLGQANLKARAGHARTLSSIPGRRIETVLPSTTGAALTTFTTGRLPGEHGLIGYRIRHPRLGLLTTLSEWDGITDPASWQRATPLFGRAAELGARAIAVGRPAHAEGGLTAAILGGAEYLGGRRIEDRFALASAALRGPEPVFAYLYIDELDRAAHEHGWESEAWLRRLEQLDVALGGFLRALPGDVGVVVTADHGMIDVPAHAQVMMDEGDGLLEGVAEVGGEPRMRSLYLEHGADADRLVERWREAEGARAWIGTRAEAIAAGWYGSVDESVAERLGEVIVAARKKVAYYCSDDSPRSLAMVGQHGSLSAEERGVPLLCAGKLAGTGFVRAVEAVAKTIQPTSA